jgi:PAS domain S-box-containing protein
VFIEAFAALFAITFLDIRNLSQKLFYYLIFLVVSNIPIVIIELMGLLGTNSLLQNMQVILSALSLLCIVVYAIIKKRPGAWIYLISWFSLLTSIVIYIFMIMGLLPDSPYVSHIIPIGSTLETILLSLALADRINSLGKEKQLILKKSLEDSNNYNEELAQREEELASNEEELRVANDALSSANEYLENFLAQEKMLNEQLTINEEELTSKEEELRQSLEELSTINEELVHVNELTRKRERQVSAIFDNTTDIIVSIDIDFKITIANKRFKEIFEKFTNEDYQSGIYVLDVIPNDKKHFYLNTYRKVLSGEYIFQVTDNYEDGLERYISEEFYSPIRDLDGEISGVAIFIRDITKRIDTEERIKKQELLFSAIINSTNNFVLSLDENLKLLAFNKNYEQRASKVFNRKIESGKISAFELLPPQFHEIYNDIFQKVFKGESVVKIFHRPKVIDGLDEIFSEEFFNPILNENGEVKGIAIFVSDITARVVAEKKLNENQKLLSMGQKMAKLGSWVLILKTGEIKFSDQMFEIYEYPKSKVITIGVFLEIVGPDVYERNRQMFEYTIKEKKPFSIEYKYIAPSGKVKYIFGMGNPILNEEGELIEILGIGQDITEIREAEEKLRFQTEELIESNMKTSEYKLMALRSVMNPHFLFNSLNSIQYFIIKNDREQALNYLSTFSKLIRSILNSSIENSYTLSEEIDLLKLYISLETLRFDQKFKTVFKVDKNLELENIEIPTLILQPYVENAILHGLYNKLGDTEGKLMIEFKKKGDSLVCIVEDNGVGREEAKKIREASRLHKSVGMMVTQERLDLINKNNNLSVKITDLVDKEGAPCGTRVEITVLIYN